MRILTAIALLLAMSAAAFPGPDLPGEDTTLEQCLAVIGRGAEGSGPPLPAVFGLVSWNVRKGLDRGWEEDLRTLAGSAHLVFLQEARPGPRLDRLLEALPHRHFVAGFSLAGRPTGVLTASTAESPLACSLRRREPWLGTAKGTAVTLHALGRERGALLGVNLHGINLSIGTRVFREQLQALEPLLAAHPGPIVVGGDLNAWSPARLAAVDALAARHGLRQVAFQPDLRSRIVGLAMDYIYLRGLDTVLAEALPVTSSDHNPLLLKLALPPAD